MNENELLRLAEKELLGEAQRAQVRYTTAGPSGWMPCPLKKPNKTFLANTLLQTLSSNRVIERRLKGLPPPKVKERKLLQAKSGKGPNSDNIIFKKSIKPVSEKKQKDLKSVSSSVSHRNSKKAQTEKQNKK